MSVFDNIALGGLGRDGWDIRGLGMEGGPGRHGSFGSVDLCIVCIDGEGKCMGRARVLSGRLVECILEHDISRGKHSIGYLGLWG